MFLLDQEDKREKFFMSNDFSINDYKDNSAYQILRGIKKAHREYDFQKTTDTTIIDFAQTKADKTENKSAITVALEDFTRTTNGFNGSSSSNIVESDTELSFFEKIGSFFGKKTDNMFKTKEGQELVASQGKIFQNDIYDSDYAKNGGIRYAKEGDDLYESALNFAKADIGAIEKAYQMANLESNNNGKLESFEAGSYTEFDGNLHDAIQELDLGDSKKKLTAEEYASYLIAVDQMGNSDGVISSDEAAGIIEMKNSDLASKAKTIFEEHYD